MHFAVHHLADRPSAPGMSRAKPSERKLSTGDEHGPGRPVDDFAVVTSELPAAPALGRARTRLWIGTVVPKRHARRAVTRTLLKRQIHAALAANVDSMASGLWVVRLRVGFERTTFPSAASTALQRAARDELDRLLARCAEMQRSDERSPR
ncbi:MAG: ribonuclease P protein component [Pseudomonadota bacterium]|nr:ribonuclease P protein component [Pseudomonadota bacterium]